MKLKEKPKYNTLQNVGWMIKIAWNSRKRVMLFCVLTAMFEVLLNLTQLYIAPEVLTRVEQRAPVWELLLTINAADQKVLDVTFPGIALKGSNTAAVTDTKVVSVAAMPADALFGTWSGTFYYDVEMVDTVEMITFTINNKEHQAEAGMTWTEWVNSEYNTDGYSISTSGYGVRQGSMTMVSDPEQSTSDIANAPIRSINYVKETVPF